jgi:cell division protein FtsB
VSPAARERAAKGARRRWLILFAVVLIVVVGILANIKPLTHYQDASARLGKATVKVNDLQAQKTELQDQVAKLSETGYLETLAREKLTYAKPGEDVYIVTPDPNDSASTGTTTGTATGLGPGLGAAISSEPGSSASTSGTSAGTATDSTNATSTGGAQPGERPGILERIISAIRGAF